jgi:hypothetical protein
MPGDTVTPQRQGGAVPLAQTAFWPGCRMTVPPLGGITVVPAGGDEPPPPKLELQAPAVRGEGARLGERLGE